MAGKAAEHSRLPRPFCYFLGQCQKVKKKREHNQFQTLQLIIIKNLPLKELPDSLYLPIFNAEIFFSVRFSENLSVTFADCPFLNERPIL
jgi:hypothetical protein